jgi:hypothetical protein
VPRKPLGDEADDGGGGEAATEVMQRVDRAIRTRVFTTPFPGDFTSVRARNGQLVLAVEGEFEVSLTLAGPLPGDPWRLLWLDVLVPGVEASTRRARDSPPWLLRMRDWVAALLVRRGVSDPLMACYRALHYFCLDLRIRCVKAEAKELETRYRHGSTVFRREDDPARRKAWALYYWCSAVKRPSPDKPHLLFSVDEWGQL